MIHSDSFFQSPLLTAAEMRTWESLSVEQGLTSYQALMEQAGIVIAQEIMRTFTPRPTLILCGPGNNGGDGYVAARHLKKAGWPITIAADYNAKNILSPEAHANLHQWKDKILDLRECEIHAYGLVIDALFGSGLNRPLEGIYAQIIQQLSSLSPPCVSVDIPSGISSDTGHVLGVAARASITIAFGALKPGHVLLPGKDHCGKVILAPLHLVDLSKMNKAFPRINSPALWNNKFPFPKMSDHKYRRGHVMIIGSESMTGASRLAALAARRIGAGLVTIACPRSIQSVYQSTCLGTLVAPYANHEDLSALIEKKTTDVLLIGVGLPPTNETRSLVLECLKTKKPCVIDAGGLSCFEAHTAQFLEVLHENTLLLPHEGEFNRLFPSYASKLESCIEAVKTMKSTLLFKGSDTVIAASERICSVNVNAPPTLATAGTGDVLAGIAAGLWAQELDPYTSALMAAWIQGETAHKVGLGLIAEDLPDKIPLVLRSLYERLCRKLEFFD